MSRPIVMLVTRDLMLQSQLGGAAAQAGVSLQVVAARFDTDALSNGEPAAIVVDLSAKDIDIGAFVEQCRQAAGEEVPIWAFGPHVHVDRLKAARSAGCDVVTSRGDFVMTAAERFATLMNG